MNNLKEYKETIKQNLIDRIEQVLSKFGDEIDETEIYELADLLISSIKGFGGIL